MKEKILNLRKEGKSYLEIAKILNINKANVQYHCSDTCREKSRIARNKNRKIQKLKLKMEYGGKCKICGYNKCLSALCFHHTGKEKKYKKVSDLWQESKTKAIQEAKKCILICSNCHAELHEGLISQII